MPTMRRALLLVLAAALQSAVAVPAPAAEDDLGRKLLELQARIDQLSRRVEVLEAQAPDGLDSSPGVRTGKDLVWHFDEYLAESPFQVSQQELDRKTGQVDLLLGVAAEPADLDLWQTAPIGGAVPVEVTASLAGGGTIGPIAFTLYRRTALAVGSQVHVVAKLSVSDPRAVRRLVVRHQGAR